MKHFTFLLIAFAVIFISAGFFNLALASGPTILMSATPTATTVNTPVTVAWIAQDAKSCSGSIGSGYPGQASGFTVNNIIGSVSVKGTAAGNLPLTIRCVGLDSVIKSKTVTVVISGSAPINAAAVNISGLASGGTWPAGASRTVVWTTNSFTGNVEIWLCTGTDPNKNCSIRLIKSTANDGSEPITLSTLGSNYRIYVRKYGDSANTYVGNGFSYPFSVVLAAPSTPADPPKITSVSIPSVSALGNKWPTGSRQRVYWQFANFKPVQVGSITKDVKTVSLSVCNPTTSGASEKCSLFGTANNKSNLVSSGGGAVSGSANSQELIGPNVYNTLTASLNLPLSQKSFFVASFDGYRTRVKICPTMSGGNSTLRNGENMPNGVCAYSPIFSVSDPNVSNSATFNLPTGEGCFENDCVCDRGQVKRCGNPMRSGAGCPAMPGCASASAGSRLLAAIGSIFSSVAHFFGR